MGFDDARRDPRQIGETTDESAVRCARCDHAITTSAARCARGDPPAHTHTFVNPHGFAFAVACYADAPGAAPAGTIESAFSWFPGFTWQFVACARCRAHLGWHFACPPDAFVGLIATAIRT